MLLLITISVWFFKDTVAFKVFVLRCQSIFEEPIEEIPEGNFDVESRSNHS